MSIGDVCVASVSYGTDKPQSATGGGYQLIIKEQVSKVSVEPAQWKCWLHPQNGVDCC